MWYKYYKATQQKKYYHQILHDQLANKQSRTLKPEKRDFVTTNKKDILLITVLYGGIQVVSWWIDKE